MKLFILIWENLQELLKTKCIFFGNGQDNDWDIKLEICGVVIEWGFETKLPEVIDHKLTLRKETFQSQ